MKKKVISFTAVLSLVFAMSVSAFAASYTFNFKTPFVGSLLSTSAVAVKSLKTAYVNPNTSATPTTYFLGTTASVTTNATNYFTNVSTSGKRSFTYNAGYGGVGTQYKLAGYPSNFDFQNYKVAGTWSP